MELYPSTHPTTHHRCAPISRGSRASAAGAGASATLSAAEDPDDWAAVANATAELVGAALADGT